MLVQKAKELELEDWNAVFDYNWSSLHDLLQAGTEHSFCFPECQT